MFKYKNYSDIKSGMVDMLEKDPQTNTHKFSSNYHQLVSH